MSLFWANTRKQALPSLRGQQWRHCQLSMCSVVIVSLIITSLKSWSKVKVKSSNDRKLALHIACAPNAKEYPRCCLPVISLLRTVLAHAHACIQSLTRKPHFRQPGLNSLQPTSECGLVSTRVQLRFIEREFSVNMRNPNSTRVQVAVRTCLKWNHLWHRKASFASKWLITCIHAVMHF